MEIDKLRLYLDFAKFFLGTFLIGLITFIVKSGFESREIALKESEHVGEYVEIALREDIGVRKRFAEYFKTVTISDKYRNRWTNYYEVVKDEYDSIKKASLLVQQTIDSIKNLADSMEVNNDLYLDKIKGLEEQKSRLKAELEVHSDKQTPKSYRFSLYSLNPVEGIKKTIINYMESEGFSYINLVNPDSRSRRSWMAERSTIFYYSIRSKCIADNIATALEESTGVVFLTEEIPESGRVRGLGDDDFMIHYIN